LKGNCPMKHIVSNKVFSELLDLLPTPKQQETGRPKCEKEALLRGILVVLKYDIPWNHLEITGASGTSCWRYFKEIQRRGLFKLVFQALAQSNLDIRIFSIDSTTTTSFNFKGLVGFSGKHKKYGTKISVLSDAKGLPYDMEFGKGSKHDLKFVQKHLDNTSKKKKQILNLDKGYTSIDLRRDLAKKKIKVNMETRTKDYHHKRGPKFKLNEVVYKLRFNLEKTFGWMKAFRRVRTRKDRYVSLFKAFVYLAAIIVLIRNMEF
jgi:putative transposase